MGMNSAPKPRPTMATRIFLSVAMESPFTRMRSANGVGDRVCGGAHGGKRETEIGLGVCYGWALHEMSERASLREDRHGVSVHLSALCERDRGLLRPAAHPRGQPLPALRPGGPPQPRPDRFELDVVL